MMLLHRRRGDVADLAHLQTQLEHERAHSADLARQLAELRELYRAAMEGRDHYRGRCRILTADVVALKADLRRGQAS